MKITILQNDIDDYRKSKIQLETDFIEIGDISATVLLFVCDGDTKVATFASFILANGSSDQRESLFSEIDKRTNNEYSTLTTFLRRVYQTRDVVQNQLSQPTEAGK